MIKKTLRKVLGPAEYKRLRNAVKPSPRDIVHFLHIGKNAGTQVEIFCDLINSNADSTSIELHKEPHHVLLKDLPDNARYFFSVRDPIKRFKSGFYSRQRKGQPRLYSEWNEHEAPAFATFEHANDLAEALFEDGPMGQMAMGAIHSIRHTAMNQVDWFCQRGNFLEVHPPMAILRQDHLAADFEVLKSRLGITMKTLPERDKGKAHAINYEAIPDLSEKACRNLRQCYAQDSEFVARRERWAEENMY